MGETHQQQQSSRLGLLKGGGGGEIVEVQGGHIVRSTGRKDRHSKVCTAKGPRDRRVRLSAHTAIQFYDVQDRLGYDRPSKAVDWLIKKAKSAIDELAVLPPWRPTATATATANTNTTSSQPSEQNQDEDEEEQNQNEMGVGKRGGGSDGVSSGYGYEHQQGLNNNPSNTSSGFLPPSLDSDSIADTIKSFFPIGATASSSSIQFQNYPPDLLSRTSSQTQDLRLSLQSFQDPILLHHHSSQEPHFPISAPMSFDPNTSNNTWSDQQPSEMSRFQRMVAWNTGGDSSSGGGFVFNSQPLSQPLLGQNPFFQQRGPLQSINSPQIRVWSDPNAVGNHYQLPTLHPSPISGIGYTSGGFSGFRVPARIQGDEEHDPASNKPSSASRH